MADLSYFFCGYISWIIEESIKQGIEKIYFFTREGEFFKELYDEIGTCSLCQKKIPRAEIIEVSRMSTFMPSLREISISEFKRIWNQYTVQSMEALCRSLHMDICLIKNELKKYKIAQDERIQNPWSDERIIRLFQDKSFLHVMEVQRDFQRKLLYVYLEQKGWKRLEKNRIGIVDIGWRGTIQDNLCWLYPNYEIAGFYTGLQPFLSEQPANSKKYGYMDQYKYKDIILSSVRPFEMLCNSPSGSTQGYRVRKGSVYAVKKIDHSENSVYHFYSKKRQTKIKADLKKCMQKMQGDKQFYKRRAMKALYFFIAYPDRKSVEAYYALNHNEEFGMGEYVRMKAEFKAGIFLKAAVSDKGRQRLKELLRDSVWPQGYLAKCRLYPLLIPYNLLFKKYLKEKCNKQNTGADF